MGSIHVILERKALVNLTLIWLLLPIVSCYDNEGGVVFDPAVVKDGGNGVIVAYSIAESHQRQEVYVRRMDSQGKSLWGDTDVQIGTCYNESPEELNIFSDDHGGAIIGWYGYREKPDFKLPPAERNVDWLYFVTCINSEGDIVWEKDLDLATDLISIGADVVVSDGKGGIVIVRREYSNEYQGERYVVIRIDSNGNYKWESQGLELAHDAFPTLVYSGDGGVIVRDLSLETITKITSEGDIDWKTKDSFSDSAVCDGTGGLLFCTDRCTQRIDSEGNKVWPNWKCANAPNREEPLGYNCQVINDGLGGALVSWQEALVGSVYVQWFDKTGDARLQIGGFELFGKKTHRTPSNWLAGDNNGHACLVMRAPAEHNRFHVVLFDLTGDSASISAPIAVISNPSGYEGISSNGLHIDQDGLYICWTDHIYNPTKSYIQRIEMGEMRIWANEGILLNP